MASHNTTSKQEFKQYVLESKKVVLVDFWAEWCPPCRAMAPILHDVAEEMDKLADVVKVNIEDGPDNTALAGEYQVQSIPTMHMFKDGKLVDTIIGMTPKMALIDLVKQHAGK